MSDEKYGPTVGEVYGARAVELQRLTTIRDQASAIIDELKTTRHAWRHARCDNAMLVLSDGGDQWTEIHIAGVHPDDDLGHTICCRLAAKGHGGVTVRLD